MSETVTTNTSDVAAFEAACAALNEAEARLRDAVARADELDARARQLDEEAAEHDRVRGDHLARGEMTAAAATGKRFAAAHDGAQAARREAAALRAAIGDLEIGLLDAEEAASDAHASVMQGIHDAERAKLLETLRTAGVRAWRAGLAAGSGTPFQDWLAGLAADADCGDGFLHSVDVGLPVQENVPTSSLLGAGSIRSFMTERTRRGQVYLRRSARRDAARKLAA